jgi:hypothetical protein
MGDEMHKVTAQIQEQWLREIVAKRKRIEYREIKPFWDKRFSGIRAPFHLRLINGMRKKAPEVTIVVTKIVKSGRTGQYHLHLGRIISVKSWNQLPKRPR